MKSIELLMDNFKVISDTCLLAVMQLLLEYFFQQKCSFHALLPGLILFLNQSPFYIK